MIELPLRPVYKTGYYVPISVEMWFDITPWAELPMWLRKEWFKRGYALGAQAIDCDWPRPRWRSYAEMKRDRHEARLEDRIRDRCRDD